MNSNEDDLRTAFGRERIRAASEVVLGEFTWLYDVAFLLVALVPLTVVAARLYVSLDPAADLLADRLDSDSPQLDLSDPASDDADGS